MNRDWYISPRPAGDFAVQRVVNGTIIRWGVYPKRHGATGAEGALRVARAGESSL